MKNTEKLLFKYLYGNKQYGPGILLGFNDFKTRYLRTKVGLAWNLVSTIIFIMVMGPIYGLIFNRDPFIYTQYICVGVIYWNLIQNAINDGANSYLSSAGYILNSNISFNNYLVQALIKNILLFILSLTILFFIKIIFGNLFDIKYIELFIGTIINLTFIYYLTSFLAPLAVFYRDIVPLTASILNFAAFFTPIIWEKELLNKFPAIVDWNPLYHFITIIRRPYFGESADVYNYTFCLITIILVYLLSKFGKHNDKKIPKYL